MELGEAIRSRHSVRAFLDRPVDENLIKEIIGQALRSPSASNTQPWEFAVVSGKKLEEIKQAFLDNSAQPFALDIPLITRYPEPWNTRMRGVVGGLQQKLGIERTDKQRRQDWSMSGYRLWGAPACIYIMIDNALYRASESQLNQWPVFDCGIITQSILLLATAYGLGTIPAIQTVMYPQILRQKLEMPDSRLFVIGIAIGYEDETFPANSFRSEREPLEKVARFYR